MDDFFYIHSCSPQSIEELKKAKIDSISLSFFFDTSILAHFILVVA